jgi:hypothetical protein
MVALRASIVIAHTYLEKMGLPRVLVDAVSGRYNPPINYDATTSMLSIH